MFKNIKKILAYTLSLSFVLGNIIPAKANEIVDSVGSVQDDITNEIKVGQDTTQGKESEYYEGINADKIETTNIYATIASEFNVLIPKTVILDGISKIGHYSVRVSGDIASNEFIKVIPDNFLTLSSINKDSIIGLINQDKIEWSYYDTNIDGIGTIEANDMTAGKWNGTFNFNVKLERSAILETTATNKNNEPVMMMTNSVVGAKKDTLLNALEQSGQIESVEEVDNIINIDNTEDVYKVEIDVNDIANPGDTIVVVHEKQNEWEYISTETVDSSGKITVNVENSQQIAFIEKNEDGTVHIHYYTEEIAQPATCFEDGVLLMACDCEKSYSFDIPAGHEIEMVEKKDENGEVLREIDWEKTTAVAPRGLYIYINLKGRNPYGIVDPADKWELEEKIITDLYNYRYNGKRCVGLALRQQDAALLGLKSEIDDGSIGDIVYWLSEGFNRVHGDSLSTYMGTADTSESPIFVIGGRGVKQNFYTSRVIRQVDVAPTMATLLGTRMPAQCEGAPVYQILDLES